MKKETLFAAGIASSILLGGMLAESRESDCEDNSRVGENFAVCENEEGDYVVYTSSGHEVIVDGHWRRGYLGKKSAGFFQYCESTPGRTTIIESLSVRVDGSIHHFFTEIPVGIDEDPGCSDRTIGS